MEPTNSSPSRWPDTNNFEVTSSNLAPIVTAFQSCNLSRTHVEIRQDSGRFVIEIKTLSIWEYYIPWFRNFKPENRATIQNLAELIGAERLKRIFQKKELGLSLSSLENQQLFLTQDVVKKIFVGLGDIRLEDLKEKLPFTAKKIDEIDAAYRALIPFPDCVDLFFGNCPELGPFDKPKTSGKGFEGLRERVWTVLSFKQKSDVVDRFISETEMLTSRLADREPPEGTLVRRHNGYFVCEKNFISGGAFVSVFSDIQGTETPFLLCRGTAMRWSATQGYLSGINDLLPEIGSYGFNAIRKDLLQYLKAQKIDKIEILGKSLGGAFALYCGIFLQKAGIAVKSIHTFCSVSVTARIKKIVEELKLPHQFIRNAGDDGKKHVDYIPLFGGSLPSHTSLYYIGPPGEKTILGIPKHPSAFTKIVKVLQSFGGGHTHQVALQEYTFKEVKGDELKQELERGQELEGIRSIIAKIFSILTLSYFNTPAQVEG